MIAEQPREGGAERHSLVVWSGLIAGLVALLAAFWYWVLRRPRPSETPTGVPYESIHGLSEEEAAARKVEGQSNNISFHPPRSRKQIIRDNSLTVFNIGLVAIIFVQLLLGKYLDALVSVGVLIFTIGINIIQEEFARIRLRKIMEDARPMATVIRDGRMRSIDPDDVVPGDALAIGPGDQTVVDGKVMASEGLVVDESLVFAKGRAVTKQAGDKIFAGSLCIGGRGAYQATRIGKNRLIERKLEHLATAPETLTPIERIINRTLQLLLAFVLAIAAFLLSKFYLTAIPFPPEFTDAFIDAIGVIFSIAPAGLFFMIVLTYAGATVDLAHRGALVQEARSVETLAQTDIVCFGKAGFLTSDWVKMTPVPAPKTAEKDNKPPSEDEIRKMLGTFARSSSMRNRFIQTLKQAFEGEQLPPTDEMPFLGIYGWSGVSLDVEDVRGVFVLSAPDELQSHLAGEQKQDEEPSKGVLKHVKGVGGRLGKLFGRKGKTEAKPENAVVPAQVSPPEISPEENPATVEPAKAAETPPSGSIFKRWGKSITARIRRSDATQQPESAVQKKPEEGVTLMFAWRPDPAPLHDETGAPRLPDGLIPLCQLTYHERINPEAVQALGEFYESGVQIAIFSSDPAEKTLEELHSAGISDETASRLALISGDALAEMDEQTFAQAVNAHQIFGNITAVMMTRVVQALRETGHRVGVVGAGVDEIHAMLNADISLTTLTASSGALSIADIILLETSPTVTSRIIDKGQRIVNGLLDVLKIYLTQALYLLLLVLALLFLLKSFPYKGAQGGLIAAFAISIPAVAITLTAPAGRLNAHHLGRYLAAFVIPAGVSIAVAGYIIFARFYHLYDVRAEAQIGLVHGLVLIGLLLAILIRPPIFFTTNINTLARNLLTTIVAIISGAVFLLTTHIKLAQKFLHITPLKSFDDYLFVANVSLIWAGGFAVYLLLTFGVKQLVGTIQRGSSPQESSASSGG